MRTRRRKACAVRRDLNCCEVRRLELADSTPAAGGRQHGSGRGGGFGYDAASGVKPHQGDYIALACGAYHTCALRRDGHADCWGDEDLDGVATALRQTTTVAARTFTTMSAGEGFTCGLEASGAYWCWGSVHYSSVGALLH